MDKRIALKDLEPGANFIRRHIGPDEAETAAMLKTVGASTLDDFIDKVVPRKIRAKRPQRLTGIGIGRNGFLDRQALGIGGDRQALQDRNHVPGGMLGNFRQKEGVDHRIGGDGPDGQ